MKVAILSDIHDAVANLRVALSRAQAADTLLCAGDLCSPFMVKELGTGFAGPIHVVFGNNDGDRFRIANNAVSYPHMTLHGEFAELELGGRHVALHHFDDVGRALARGGTYDLVVFGHNHRYEVAREADGRTLLVNPGEVYGGLSGAATFVLYDTESGEAERLECGA